MTVQSAYIHIPFCVRICTYCDFNKYFIQNQPVDEYLDALITEMSTAKYGTLKDHVCRWRHTNGPFY